VQSKGKVPLRIPNLSLEIIKAKSQKNAEGSAAG
jgi:hypothetical protein